MQNVIISYTNGSQDTTSYSDYMSALRFCQKGISYSGGKVRRVEIETQPGSLRAMWDISWDAVSQAAGLRTSK